MSQAIRPAAPTVHPPGSNGTASRATFLAPSNAASPDSPISFRQVAMARLREATDPDVTVVADGLVGELGQEELREALRQVLPSYLNQLARAFKHETLRRPGSAKWRAAANAAEDIFKVPYSPGGGAPKFLGELTVVDVQKIVLDYRGRAEEQLEWGRRFKQLAKVMRERSVQYVRDLPADEVLGILHG